MGKKGFSSLILIVILLLVSVLVVGGTKLFEERGKQLSTTQTNIELQPSPSITPSEKPYAEFEPLSNGLKKYRNLTYKYEITLPESWVAWPDVLSGSSEKVRVFANKEPGEGPGGYTPTTIRLRINVYEGDENLELLKKRFTNKIGTVDDGVKYKTVKLADLTINGLKATKVSLNTENKPTDLYYETIFSFQKNDGTYSDLEFLSPSKESLDANMELSDQIANSFKVIN